MELRELLFNASKNFDQSRLDARVEECLAAGADVNAVNAWFEKEYQVTFAKHDRALFTSNPRGAIAARIREAMRAELSQFERWVMLQTIDNAWKEHLRSMDQIRDAIGFRAFSQKDPRIEFKKESSRLYTEMLEGVQNRLSEILLKGELVPQVQQQQAPATQASAPQEAIPATDQAAHQEPVVVTQVASKRASSVGQAASAVVGRNEMCPCGSGKKFKHCHGAKGAAAPQEQSQQ